MGRNKIKKYLFFFDSRATFAYSNNIIKIFKKKKINYQILVSGNYLEKEMKIDRNIFKKYGLKITSTVKFKSPAKGIDYWPVSFGKAMIKYAYELKKIKPDIAIITGDRVETLAFCITCAYMNIPIAHVQAGDKSGHIDDLSRAAIAKFSNLHFAPSKQACKRLINWGEDKKRIFFTGAPQLDDIYHNHKTIKSNYFVVIFHPVLNEQEKIDLQLKNLIQAIDETGIKVVWIYPNNDVGYKKILKKIKKYKTKNIKITANYERSEFIELLKKSKGMIGNSSAGIIEASMLKLPVINIGSRQNGRPQSNNILNCNSDLNNIKKKINYINKNIKFIKSLQKIKNPYFLKNSGELITKILTNLKSNNSLLKKY